MPHGAGCKNNMGLTEALTDVRLRDLRSLCKNDTDNRNIIQVDKSAPQLQTRL